MCALRLCKLLSTVKILLFLTRDFLLVLCHVQGSEFREFREISFNMTRGGDEDIETRSLKF